MRACDSSTLGSLLRASRAFLNFSVALGIIALAFFLLEKSLSAFIRARHLPLYPNRIDDLEEKASFTDHDPQPASTPIPKTKPQSTSKPAPEPFSESAATASPPLCSMCNSTLAIRRPAVAISLSSSPSTTTTTSSSEAVQEQQALRLHLSKFTWPKP